MTAFYCAECGHHMDDHTGVFEVRPSKCRYSIPCADATTRCTCDRFVSLRGAA